MSSVIAVVLVTLVVVVLAWGAEIHRYSEQASRNAPRDSRAELP